MSGTPARRPQNNDWLVLQKKIFTRWVNQKLNVASLPPINDFVSDVAKDPKILIRLAEILAEKKFAGKLNNSTMRVMLINNANEAIKFVTGVCGVVLKPLPSAEDLCDGNERNVLGMLWNIMMKFMKFEGEEGEATLSAKDSLLMWCKNKTHGYPNVAVENLTTSFHDGLALCAIIHKHRPQLIPDMATMTPDKKRENILLAMDAAERYFGLEKYITPEELTRLDENSMTVYISEYYYGIAEQRKVDLAARRITKVVKFTEQNDAAKLVYNDEATKLVAHMKTVGVMLGDRTIDNTMAGAKKRIEDFYVYKSKDKNEIIQSQLTLEAVYNNLSMVLSQHKRPDYVPPAGCSLKDVEASVNELERCEVERKVALHAELNRQINLVRLDEQHAAQHAKFVAWADEKRAYLNTKEVIESVGVAIYQIAVLDAFDADAQNVKEATIGDMATAAAGMAAEKYENIARVEERVTQANATIEELAALSAKKRPVLLDDLAREEFKERVRLDNENSINTHKRIVAWVAEKEAYLNVKEQVDSVTVAQEKLAILEGYEQEKINMNDAFVNMLKEINNKLRSSVYETEYSSWRFETPEVLDQREAEIAAGWEKLSQLSAHKLAVLQDDLAREQFREKVTLMTNEHLDMQQQINHWAEEKIVYLNTREEIHSVHESQLHLNLFGSYGRDKAMQTKTRVASLKTLGAEILASKYETEYSSWVFDKPDEITAREANVDESWAKLDELAEEKKRVLDDHLARETYAAETRVLNRGHIDKYDNLMNWVGEKKTYLNTKEAIDTVPEAQTQLALLESYHVENDAMTKSSLASLKTAGEVIISRKYETSYSSYVFENPAEITERESAMAAQWTELESLAGGKRVYLDAELKREQEKERLRLEFAAACNALTRWSRSTKDKVDGTHFGFTLEEVQATEAKLREDDAAIAGKAAEMVTGANATFNAAVEMGVKENIYTTESPESLEALKADLQGKLAEREQKYQTELARQIANDNLCKEFATAADPFAKTISDEKDRITHAKETLEEQLKFVAERIANHGDLTTTLATINEISGRMDAAGITNNRHTTLTAKDAQVLFEQFVLFLEKKKTMLEQEIEHEKLRGLTPEQMAEIDANFVEFDKNGDNELSKQELKAMLYSIGEEKSPSEVDHILKTWGNGTILKKDEFKEYMISYIGDSDTKDEVINSFKLINKSEIIVKDRFEMVMKADDIAFILKTAPAVEGGHNYAAWVDEVFSR